MKTFITLCVTVFAALTLSAQADTVTGTACCAKCKLHVADACQMAISVKGKDGKTEVILADNNDVAKDFHSNICKKAEKVTAEGTITEKDGKKTIALTKVEAAK